MQKISPAEMADVAEWFVHAVDYPAREQRVPAAPAAVARWLADADALVAARDRVAYCSLFDIGNPAPPVPLLESHYHRDPTARLRRVVNFYRAYGVVQDAHHAPDHLCVELAYLAYLARIATRYPLRHDLLEAAQAFARAHPASFVHKCAKVLVKHDSSGVYIALFAALSAFLADVGGDVAIAFSDADADAGSDADAAAIINAHAAADVRSA